MYVFPAWIFLYENFPGLEGFPVQGCAIHEAWGVLVLVLQNPSTYQLAILCTKVAYGIVQSIHSWKIGNNKWYVKPSNMR